MPGQTGPNSYTIMKSINVPDNPTRDEAKLHILSFVVLARPVTYYRVEERKCHTLLDEHGLTAARLPDACPACEQEPDEWLVTTDGIVCNECGSTVDWWAVTLYI